MDVEHYEELTRASRQEYEDALAAYSIYTDRHKDAVLQTYISTRDKLENDMQIKYSTYSALTAQLVGIILSLYVVRDELLGNAK